MVDDPKKRPEVIHLLVGPGPSGRPVHEEVVATAEDHGHYRIVKSPGLVLGIAAGDVIDRRPDGSFVVVRRGGNFCVQVFALDGLARVEVDATEALTPLGGWLDGSAAKERVFTVPAAATMERITSAMDGVQSRHPKMEWYYGNAFADDGVTPLNWWK
jgi:hypothetical protein